MRANKRKLGQVLVWVLLLTCVAAGIFYGLRAWQEERPKLEAEKYYDSLRQESVPEGDNQSAPGRILPEGAVGWIWCPDTVIDYPIMQWSDNDYYLHHLPDGSGSDIGSIFLDAENQGDFTDDLSVIYGHHITRGRMFTPLTNYRDPSYYIEHPKMYLYLADGKTYQVQLFAGEVADGASANLPTKFSTGKERGEFVQEKKRNSTFTSDIKIGKKDSLIALCTCTYEFSNARYILYGKLVLEEEK